ncbi:hypothetical protein TPA0908_33640 [Micromonospora sp. AKA38]|nr:hypothetical protein TPA0908_33640 [Micromonospora sp. AKA38]
MAGPPAGPTDAEVPGASGVAGIGASARACSASARPVSTPDAGPPSNASGPDAASRRSRTDEVSEKSDNEEVSEKSMSSNVWRADRGSSNGESA